MAGQSVKRAERAAKGRRAKKASATWNLSFETTYGPALQAVEDIAFQQTKWKPAFKDLAKRIEEGATGAFNRATGPDGYNWPALTPAYRQRKQGRGALVLSGKLQSRTKVSKAVKVLTGDRLVYEVNQPYAAAHQFGKPPNNRKGKHGGFPGARVRNYILWGDELKAAFADSLNRYGEKRRSEILRKAGRGGG